MSSINDFILKNMIVGNGNLNATIPDKIIGEPYPNKIIIVEGNNAKYKIEKSGYKTVSGLIQGSSSIQNVDILLYKLHKFTIIPDPSNANVTLIATGFKQEGNSISVTAGTKITYYVKASSEYKEASGYYVVTDDDGDVINYPISLRDNMYTVTIRPSLLPPITNETADVLITSSNPEYTQQGNSIIVPYISYNGIKIYYKVSKNDYETITDEYTLESPDNKYIDVTCKKFYKVTIKGMLDGFDTTSNDANINVLIYDAKGFKTNHYYDAHSLITYGDSYYNCKNSFTSGEVFNIDDWDKIEKVDGKCEINFWVTHGTRLNYVITRDGYSAINETITVTDTTNIEKTLKNLQLFCVEEDDSIIFMTEGSPENNPIYLQDEEYGNKTVNSI